MSDNESAILKMFNGVREFCTKNLTILNTYIPFPALLSIFDAKLNELSQFRIAQAITPIGFTEDKAKLRKQLEKNADILSGKLSNLAILTNDLELERRVYYTPSTLLRAKEKELSGICTQMTTDAEANLAGLAPYGIDTPWLAAFTALNKDFLKKVGGPASLRADIKIATDGIKRVIPEITEFLRKDLDRMMIHFKYSLPDLYENYKNIRIIVDRPTLKPMLKGTVLIKNEELGIRNEDTPEFIAAKGFLVLIEGTKRKVKTTEKGHFKFIRLKKGKVVLIVKDKKKVLLKQDVKVPGVVELEIGD